MSAEASHKKAKAQSKARPEPEPDEHEGWESLAEEASVGSLALNPELEEALREAAAAVDERAHRKSEKAAAAAGVAAGSSAPADAEKPQDEEDDDETGRLSVKVIELQDRLLRLQADYDNFRKRAVKERREALQYGHENLVKDLLPSVDNLERAIEHARSSSGGDLQTFLQGVELVKRELVAALGKHGVSVIEALGEEFDPARHEAMAQAHDDRGEPNSVVEVMEKGYQLLDRLLRPARVVVAKPPEEGGAERGEGGAGGSGPE